MEERIITFTANEQGLVKTGGISHYASDTISYIKAVFTLGENWQGFDEVRAVFKSPYECRPAVLDSNGECYVPVEVLFYKGKVKVNLIGSIVTETEVTDRLTTYSVEALDVDEDVPICGEESQPISPSEYEQFVAKVANDANRAEQSATDAKTYADEAEASAQNASESASASAVSASDSARSATASAESAQNASEIAVEVEVMKNEVELAKDKVLGMRATAETLEAGSDATASYSDGLLTLGIPRGDQGIQGIQGETGATPNLTIGTVETLAPTEDATATITGTAEEPVLNLGIPKGEQGDVNLSQLEALLPTDTASGSIVTIADGQSVVPAKSLKVQLEPIQDLHGYDKPWAGGAGKNKLHFESKSYDPTGVTFTQTEDNSIIVNGTASTDIIYNIKPYTNGSGADDHILLSELFDIQADTNYVLSGCPSGGSVNSYRMQLLVYGSGAEPYDTGNGSNQFSFTASYIATKKYRLCIRISSGTVCNNLVFKPMIRLASETDSSFAPYSNICPISGHTEVDTQRTGINVWDEEWLLGSIKDTDGEYISYTTRICSKNYIPIIGGASYYIHNGSNQEMGIFAYDSEYNYIGAWKSSSWQKSNGTSNATNSAITMPNNASYMKFRVVSNYGTTYNNDISINYPSTDTEYHAYQGHTYTTDLGRTVYGGTLDVVSGTLTVDRAIHTFDGTDAVGLANWRPLDNSSAWLYAPSVTEGITGVQTSATNLSEVISDTLETQTYYNLYANDNAGISNVGSAAWGIGMRVADTSLRTESAINAWLAENPVTVCYKLATPTTVQLTPQEVQLLLGTNNVWSDGNVTLVYSADIQKWVEKKLNGNSTTLTMSRPMTAELNETETE